MKTQKADETPRDIHDRNLAIGIKDVLRAQRALSREIGRLIETLLMVAMDLVGAERGMLFLVRGGQLEIEAEATNSDGGVRVAFPPLSASSLRFAQAVLRYVVRMEESVVLDDASSKNQFSEDNHLRSESIRSILYLPLIARRELVGVLYLENACAPHVFTPARLATLELLASQSAVSLKTAALPGDLAHEIKEQRKVRTAQGRPRKHANIGIYGHGDSDRIACSGWKLRPVL